MRLRRVWSFWDKAVSSGALRFEVEGFEASRLQGLQLAGVWGVGARGVEACGSDP